MVEVLNHTILMEDMMIPIQGIPLDTLTGMPRGLQNALNAAGITTIEQLVASTAAVGGPAVMAGHLGVQMNEFRRVLTEAEFALQFNERVRLKSPVDTKDLGLGALPRTRQSDSSE
jgi:hypothetical protein